MELAFNPVVTFASLLLILGFVAWAMVRPEQAGQEFTLWKAWVGLNFTWLYIGAQVGEARWRLLGYSNKPILDNQLVPPRTGGLCS